MKEKLINEMLLTLLMKKMSVKKNERFKFSNQKDSCFYYFDESGSLIKAYQSNPKSVHPHDRRRYWAIREKGKTIWATKANVSLNWILELKKDDIRFC